jgi:hypothetical protein
MKMKRMNFGFGLGAMLCAAALCFWGCESVIDAAKGKAFGTIKLKLSIGEAPKAANNISGPLFTIYPGGAEAFGNFTLSFEATEGGAPHADVLLNDITTPIIIDDLVLGVYTVKVTATRSGDETVVAMGSVSGVAVTQDPGEEETVNVILRPKTGAGLSDGTFSYNITFTEDMTTATLTITDADGVGVGDGINLLDNEGAGTKTLVPGYYYVDVTTDREDVGGGEVIHIYSGMTSAWTKEFTAGEPPPPPPAVGAVSFTVGFAHDEIPVTVAPESAKVVKEGDITFSVADNTWEDMKWYTDGNVTNKTEGYTYTVNTAGFGIGVHTVTVRAKRNGKLYSELIEFTVTAEAEDDGGLTITGVTPSNLSTKLAEIDAATNSEDNPTTLVFEDFDISGDDWVKTIYNAMADVTKYVVFDLNACHADYKATDSTIDNKIKGSANPTDSYPYFNYMRARTTIIGIILPSSLTEIGEAAFNNWTALKSITIPAAVTNFGSNPFIYTTFTRITLLTTVSVANLCLPNSFSDYVDNIAAAGSGDRIGTYVWNGGAWSKVN